MYEKQSRNTNRSTDTIASFLLKTYQILQHPEYERMISWDKSNVGFIINDVVSFTRQILPKYFRHSNFSSFVRQLNMYDFHKVKQQNQSLVFKNPLFCKGQQHNLKFIRRKAAKKVGGQRRQQTNDKNDIQNQKYENLLKGFKKSFESEINQTSIFYEKSIQVIKDLNQSNIKKQSLIEQMTRDQRYNKKAQNKNQNQQDYDQQNEIQIKKRKDTIIQIPKEFIKAEKQSIQKLDQQKGEEKQLKKGLNIDSIILLKEEVYKSLGIYEGWLNDYIEGHKKKIKYINGYRQQLTKCRQSKNTQNTQQKQEDYEEQERNQAKNENNQQRQSGQNNIQKNESNE